MERRSRSAQFAAVICVALILGAGSLILQRWVAETRFGAIVLVSVWFAIAGLAAIVVAIKLRGLRVAILGTYVVLAIASGAIGYWTGFRDRTVDEDVVVATARAADDERRQSLGAQPTSDEPAGAQTPKVVELASGMIMGADGHSGTGDAAVVDDGDGGRVLTLTKFDVDPGIQVEVYLTTSDSDVSDRIELGGLKGNVGDQQYEIPADADLERYDTLVLYCTPFTVRIAVAPLA